MYKSILTFFLVSFSLVIASAQYYTVTTIAGDTAGYRNGGNSVALFSFPSAIAADTTGNLYISDTYNNVIRKEWLKLGLVGTLAGNDSAGFRDGSVLHAEFNSPEGICLDKHGNVYVADMYNNRIRVITPAGMVSTLAGNGTPGFINGPADSAEFNLPTGVAVDTMGNVYVADDGNFSVREISTTGTVTTIAGTGVAGFHNGAGDTAKFNGLYGIVLNDSGTIYLTEYNNNDVRRIKNGIVSTVAGNDTLPSVAGWHDGQNDSALFSAPMGLVIDSIGDLFICDEFNYRVREVGINGMTSLFAGNGTPSSMDTTVPWAGFDRPYSITRIRKTFYLVDNGNNRIRKMTPPPPLGIFEVIYTEKNISVYPNPCNDKLIVASAPQGTAQILDITGREVWNNGHFKAPYIIPTDGLSPGMYFLKISNPEGSVTRKIVVER
jgi:hypothetical protein